MKGRILTADIISDFRKHLQQEEKSTATIEKYIRDVKAFFAYTADAEITKEFVIAYKQQLIRRGYAVRSVGSVLAALNSLFAFLGWADCRVKTIRMQRQTYCSEEKELTRAEYERLCRTAERKHNRRLCLILQTICSTGIRVSELQFITVENMIQFDPHKNYLIVVSGFSNAGKSSVLSNIDGRAPGVVSVYHRFMTNGAKNIRKVKKRATIDIVVALEYKGKKIGISAGGDCVKSLSWIESLKDEGCQYIITASSIHRNGDTCAYVNDFAKKNNFQLISLYKFPYQNDSSNLEEFIFNLF